MNKKPLFVSAVLIMLLLQGSTMAPQASSVTIPAAIPKQISGTCSVPFTWYNDQWMTDPTGTVSDTPTELNRLRNLYSGYIFSSTPGMGLYQFEYGHYPGYPFSIIYSNLQ